MDRIVLTVSELAFGYTRNRVDDPQHLPDRLEAVCTGGTGDGGCVASTVTIWWDRIHYDETRVVNVVFDHEDEGGEAVEEQVLEHLRMQLANMGVDDVFPLRRSLSPPDYTEASPW